MSSTDVWLTTISPSRRVPYWLGSQARRGRWRYGCTVPGRLRHEQRRQPSLQRALARRTPTRQYSPPITDLRTSAISTAINTPTFGSLPRGRTPRDSAGYFPKSPRPRPESPTIYRSSGHTDRSAHAIARAARCRWLSSDNWTIFGSDRALLWGRCALHVCAVHLIRLRCQLSARARQHDLAIRHDVTDVSDLQR